MLFAIFLLNSFLLTLALINYSTMRRPSEFRSIDESVSVLLPVRNEEANIDRILRELTSQIGLTHFQITVINDNSSDGTRSISEKYSSSIVKIVDAPPPSARLDRESKCTSIWI